MTAGRRRHGETCSASTTWRRRRWTQAGCSAVVVEYRNDALDHYFITAEPAEAAMLDAGVVVPGW